MSRCASVAASFTDARSSVDKRNEGSPTSMPFDNNNRSGILADTRRCSTGRGARRCGAPPGREETSPERTGRTRSGAGCATGRSTDDSGTAPPATSWTGEARSRYSRPNSCPHPTCTAIWVTGSRSGASERISRTGGTPLRILSEAFFNQGSSPPPAGCTRWKHAGSRLALPSPRISTSSRKRSPRLDCPRNSPKPSA